MSKWIIARGSVPEFVANCSYCETIFSYMYFDIHKKGIFRKKVVMCPVCEKPVKATMLRARESEE